MIKPIRRLYSIHAAVLRKKGGPLRIEALELEGPRDDEVLDARSGRTIKPVLRISSHG